MKKEDWILVNKKETLLIARCTALAGLAAAKTISPQQRLTQISAVWRKKMPEQPGSALFDSPIVAHDWEWVGGITNLIRFCKSAGGGW